MISSRWLERLNAYAEFDPNILRHNGIWWAADEAVLNKVQIKKFKKLPVKVEQNDAILTALLYISTYMHYEVH